MCAEVWDPISSLHKMAARARFLAAASCQMLKQTQLAKRFNIQTDRAPAIIQDLLPDLPALPKPRIGLGPTATRWRRKTILSKSWSLVFGIKP